MRRQRSCAPAKLSPLLALLPSPHQEDQAANNPDATLLNARLEGVAERIELKTADARQLPFVDKSFDVILSSWALHNIYDAAGREQAIAEIARVLKPGGQAAIIDIRHTEQYARVLAKLGFTVNRSGPNFTFIIPSHRLLAQKSGSALAPRESGEQSRFNGTCPETVSMIGLLASDGMAKPERGVNAALRVVS